MKLALHRTESLQDLVDRVVINLEGSLTAKPRDREGGKIGIQERVEELLNSQATQPTGGELCGTTPRHAGKVAGKIELLDKLRGRRVLLVLDDVGADDWNLLPPQNDAERNFLALSALGPGSIVIITSRERGILGTAGCDLLDVNLLTPQQSQLLFESHVGVIEVSANMVETVVNKCGGLPLTLKVVAGHLKTRKEEQYWHEAIDKLAKAEDLPAQPAVFARLRSSYDGLNDREKELFVDIACLLASCSYLRSKKDTTTRTLQDKWLLDVDHYGSISMHDQLRDMGVTFETGATKHGVLPSPSCRQLFLTYNLQCF
ncbi:hypothetical protein WJX72_004684 [[Myrmecia] bisecta]|uniref:NB-ARC domain-containing protein n=1 Tax=[Myrmecia] bisecta TaxID=41462 RepID=A0AAW1PJQ2_9CHLO